MIWQKRGISGLTSKSANAVFSKKLENKIGKNSQKKPIIIYIDRRRPESSLHYALHM